MKEYIINISKEVLGMERVNELLMSDLYHEVAEQNYFAYHTYQKSCLNYLRKLNSVLEETFNYNFDSIINNEDNMNKFMQNYINLDDSMSFTETVKKYPNETINNSNLVLDILSNSTGFDELKDIILITQKIESDCKGLFKAGMTSIAFEAFACEALINQELQSFMSEKAVKNYYRKKTNDKRPVYIQKLEKIMFKKSIEVDKILFSKLQYVMSSRNKIAHFNGFKFDTFEMLRNVELTMKNENKSKFYVCDIFQILAEPLEAYNKLRNILSNNSV